MDLAVERLRSLRVSDIMARTVIPVHADDTLAQAANTFVEHQISWAPVVDSEGRAIGVLSGTDFLRHEAIGDRQIASGTATNLVRVRDYMATAIQSIAGHVGMLQAARIMCAQHLHRLLVLDSSGRPLGVISSMDITAALVNVMDEMRFGEAADTNAE